MLATAMLFAGLATSASAAPPVGKDGKLHACYRVKGKPKGGLRVVPSAKARCKRGERKVAWAIAGSPGAPGQQGSTGETGGKGADGGGGNNGNNGTDGGATLSTQVATLNLKLEGLENILKGVSNGDLTGALGKLNGISGADLSGALDTVKGITNTDLTGALGKLNGVNGVDLAGAVDTVKGLTNTDLTGALGKLNGVNGADLTGAVDAVAGLTNLELTEAVGTLPAVDSLCAQAAELTKQANLLRSVFGGLGLEGVLGGLLKVPALPAVLPGFTCPS